MIIGKIKWFNEIKSYGSVDNNETKNIIESYFNNKVYDYKIVSERNLIRHGLLKSEKHLRTKQIPRININ